MVVLIDKTIPLSIDKQGLDTLVATLIDFIEGKKGEREAREIYTQFSGSYFDQIKPIADNAFAEFQTLITQRMEETPIMTREQSQPTTLKTFFERKIALLSSFMDQDVSELWENLTMSMNVPHAEGQFYIARARDILNIKKTKEKTARAVYDHFIPQIHLITTRHALQDFCSTVNAHNPTLEEYTLTIYDIFNSESFKRSTTLRRVERSLDRMATSGNFYYSETLPDDVILSSDDNLQFSVTARLGSIHPSSYNSFIRGEHNTWGMRSDIPPVYKIE